MTHTATAAPRTRILVLSSTYPRHASDTVPAFVHQLCQELSAYFEVHVLVPHDAGACWRETLDGVQVHRFPYALPVLECLAYRGGILENLKHHRWRYLLLPGFVLMQALWMIALLCRYRFALVHAHWLLPQGVVAAAVTGLPGLRVPLLVTSHGGDLFALQGGVLASLKRWVLRRAACVTVVSRVMRDRLLGWGLDAQRIHVAPMGVDLQQRFVPGHQARSGLVFVGRLAEKKGVDVLLDALARLKQRGLEPPLEIVGDGPWAARLQQQARTLGLSQLQWVGAVPPAGVPRHFQRARVAVVPSRVARDGDQEGLGLVCVEALGCGCAVVASDLPAIRDVIEPDRNGLCVPPDDPQALAAAIERLLADEALYARLVEAGQRSVHARFDWPAVGAGYAALVRGLLPPAG